MRFVSALRIVCLGSFLVSLVFVANIFQAFCLPFLLISRQLYRKCEGFVVESFLGTCCVVLRYGGGIDLQFAGDPEIIRVMMSQRPFSLFGGDKKEFGLGNVLLLGNHVSFVDWWVVYFMALRIGTFQFVRFVAKESIKFIPGLGFASYFHEFLFVRRDWKKDEARIRAYLRDFANSKLQHLWICIFPEGTFVDQGEEKLVLAAQKFVVENYPDIEPFKYVLYPKAKGFDAIIQNSGIRDILDLTFVYSFSDGSHTALPLMETGRSRKVPDTLGLLSSPPKSIFIHIRHHKYDNSLDSKEWLKKCFQEKECLLKRFHEANTFSASDVIAKDTMRPTFEMLLHLLFWVILISFLCHHLLVHYFQVTLASFLVLILIGVKFQTT
jgi:hypothetical protein